MALSRRVSYVMTLTVCSMFMYIFGALFSGLLTSEWGMYVVAIFNRTRELLISRLAYFLMSPVYELVLGITLGVDLLKTISRFNDVYIELGLIHVLVVSGYNINFVINLVFSFLRNRYHFLSVFTALFVTLFYALLVGLSAPVVRAVVMSFIYISISRLGYYYHPLKILFLSLVFVLGYDANLVSSLSLQLSFLASFGLITIYNRVYSLLLKYMSKLPELFLVDLSATISAQLFTAPLIFFSFGRFSFVSLLSNMLLLSFIPLITLISFPLLLFMFISDSLAKISTSFVNNVSILFILCSELIFKVFTIGFS